MQSPTAPPPQAAIVARREELGRRRDALARVAVAGAAAGLDPLEDPAVAPEVKVGGGEAACFCLRTAAEMRYQLQPDIAFQQLS
jgi:hypothetical protein